VFEVTMETMKLAAEYVETLKTLNIAGESQPQP